MFNFKGSGVTKKSIMDYLGLVGAETHPGSPVLYNIDIPVSQGGMGFRTRFGVEEMV